MKIQHKDRRIRFTAAALAVVLWALGGAAPTLAAETFTPAQVSPAGAATKIGGTYQVNVQTNEVTDIPPDASLRVGPDILTYDNLVRIGDTYGSFANHASSNPVYGDRLFLTEPGELRELFFSFYKNGGPLLSATFRVAIYDATGWDGMGYPATLILSHDFFVDFVPTYGAGGVPDVRNHRFELVGWPGGINLPQDILVTQQTISYDGSPNTIGSNVTSNQTPYTGSSDASTSFYASDTIAPGMIGWGGIVSNNLEYAVTACTTTEIQVSPQSITVSADVGQQIVYIDWLTISNENGCVPLEYSISSDCGISSPAGTVPAGGVGFVNLNYDTTGIPPGTYSGFVQILSNDLLLPVVTIPVTYTVTCSTGAPDIQVSPESMIAIAALGQEVVLIDWLTISNEFGCVPLDYSITSDCGLSSPPGTVPAGGVTPINLSYFPFGTAPGTYDGFVHVSSNDPDTPTASIPVSYTVTGTVNAAVSGTAYATQGPVGAARWVQIDLSTGAGTDLGWMRYGVPGLATTGDGSIIAGGLNDDIWQIDSATGTLVNVGDSACLDAMASGDEFVFGLGCDNSLYAIDPATGLLEELLLTGIDPAMGGLAVDLQTFTFYFSQADNGPGTDNLYAWDLFGGGQPVFKGSLGLGLPIGDLACDANGNLYGVVGEQTGPTYLVSINKSTGAATVIGETGINNLDALVIFGTDGVSAVSEDNIPTPSAFALHGASPNPFNPTTEISFDLPAAGDVQLTVYDVSGRWISTLVNGQMQAGRHSVRFSADRLSSGTYFYELRGNGHRETGKMVLLK